jgi:hypothetical protein
MPGLMMTVTVPGNAPSLAEAAQLLGVAEAALDHTFGVVAVDPRHGVYTVLVDDKVASTIAAGPAGPFSNPRIEPYGPPSVNGHAPSVKRAPARQRRARRTDGA